MNFSKNVIIRNLTPNKKLSMFLDNQIPFNGTGNSKVGLGIYGYVRADQHLRQMEVCVYCINIMKIRYLPRDHCNVRHNVMSGGLTAVFYRNSRNYGIVEGVYSDTDYMEIGPKLAFRRIGGNLGLSIGSLSGGNSGVGCITAEFEGVAQETQAQDGDEGLSPSQIDDGIGRISHGLLGYQIGVLALIGSLATLAGGWFGLPLVFDGPGIRRRLIGIGYVLGCGCLCLLIWSYAISGDLLGVYRVVCLYGQSPGCLL